MYIKSIELKNFKSFAGKKELQFTPGVNYLVGNNNVGKTSIFKAVEFVALGGDKEDLITIGHENEELSVTIRFEDVPELKGPLSKYENYREDSGSLTLKRSSRKEKVNQGNKQVFVDIKTVQVFNPTTQKFENPTGKANTITALFDPQFVYADIHNEDYRDFGSTKTTGKLVQKVTDGFQSSQEFTNFKIAHKKAFGSNGILKFLDATQKRLNRTLENQFGESKVHFSFDLPKVNDFLKKGSIFIDENGVETDISEKGNGLQRALALAIIQVFAEIKNKQDENMQYFIDEPEIFLHPKAQDKLIESLMKLTEKGDQVFLTTHSPYVLRHFRNKKDSITILSIAKDQRISNVDSLIFSSPSSSIGEVTYRAFGVPTVDFHQQLFTSLYLHWIDNSHPADASLSCFDRQYLSKKYHLSCKSYYPRNKGVWKNQQSRTLPYIVRNEIDHPEVLEDEKNQWKESNLIESIKSMINIAEENIKEKSPKSIETSNSQLK